MLSFCNYGRVRVRIPMDCYRHVTDCHFNKMSHFPSFIFFTWNGAHHFPLISRVYDGQLVVQISAQTSPAVDLFSQAINFDVGLGPLVT